MNERNVNVYNRSRKKSSKDVPRRSTSYGGTVGVRRIT